MPKRRSGGEIPLPEGWEECRDFDGKVFFIDHNTHQTSWIDPRDRFIKPQTFADCIGDELPYGWEGCHDPEIGVYYIDHINQVNQLEDPRQEWRSQQEHMLKEYLTTAQDDLQAKKEIYSVKEERLILAQDEYQHLTDTLTGWKSSRTSLASNSSVGSKYDPDLLKADVHHAKKRVARLRRELDQIKAEMTYKEQGLETLSKVDQKLSGENGNYNITQAAAIVGEIREMQASLTEGEHEKQNLMQSLAKLKEEFLGHKNGGSSPDVSTLSIPHMSNTASQTDLRGEVGLRSGTYIAEIARTRLKYDEAKTKLSDLKHKLANVEEQMIPGQNEMDKDRLMLISEKEQLLRELRSIDMKGRSSNDINCVQKKIQQLEWDINHAAEISNKQIADRLQLQVERTSLVKDLSDTTVLATTLETQLRSLYSSVSTLSVSSGSSLGSMGSLSSLSRSSLNSNSMIDIYGQQQHTSDLPDLHRRVEKLLQGHSISPIQEVHISDTTAAATNNYLQSVMASNLSSSMKSLSSRSSLSSVSPPISPYDIGPPPSYEQHMTGADRQRKIPTYSVNTNIGVIAEAPSGLQLNIMAEQSKLTGDPALLQVNPTAEFSPPVQVATGQSLQGEPGYQSVASNNVRRSQYPDNLDLGSIPPLSPISETSSGVCNNLSGGNTRSVSAAVSDESVAGDSGVFEASVNITKRDDLDEVLEMNLESAQIQIKLKYEGVDSQLLIGIEQGRNLSALAFPSGGKVYIKAALLPHLKNASVWETKPLADLKGPKFSETFHLTIPEHKVRDKTLQVNVWSKHDIFGDECLGCVQVSLADFDPKMVSMRWYNVLSFKFMQADNVGSKPKTSQPSSTSSGSSSAPSSLTQKEGGDRVVQLLEASSARLGSESSKTKSHHKGKHPIVAVLKEESSDESTIISSQTSTLTRNQGADEMQRHNDTEGSRFTIGDDEDEDEMDEEDEADYNEKIQEILEEFDHAVDIACNDDFIEQDDSAERCDKETNTEARYSDRPPIKRRTQDSIRSSTIRRSQTFSPACRPGSNYICKLNRSDSDGSMPNFKKGSFHRHSMERRSLRWKKPPSIVEKGRKVPPRTSLDLELDLQASQTKLTHLHDEINRLKQLKTLLEDAKSKGQSELPPWLADDEHFHKLLSDADKLTLKMIKTTQERHVQKEKRTLTKQDRRAQHLMKKVTKEVQMLKRNSPNSNALNFREKMAFFTTPNMTVPVIPNESADNADDPTIEEFLNDDDRKGEEV
ncbi:protein KIBRA [Mytilus galloprovincialis]|uniref:Protein kibra n=1 Tax=Mytilus galloprovincialis TaxID=29158 RepID=A0A8B6GXY7_MYTGA|nr:protein KIBRA [Mytilus galloprovincialis]